MTPKTIIDFWVQAGPPRWFTKDASFDGTLRVRFGEALQHARAGKYAAWDATPEGALALIILLDQVSRNLHRGSPMAFAADPQALALAKSCITRGFHQQLPSSLAQWLIMPFEHAEDIDAQRRGVALFGAMGLRDMAHWAKVHLDIIARFGRFPHRNAVLGRRSTPGELAFLASGGFSG